MEYEEKREFYQQILQYNLSKCKCIAFKFQTTFKEASDRKIVIVLCNSIQFEFDIRIT